MFVIMVVNMAQLSNRSKEILILIGERKKTYVNELSKLMENQTCAGFACPERVGFQSPEDNDCYGLDCQQKERQDKYAFAHRERQETCAGL